MTGARWQIVAGLVVLTGAAAVPLHAGTDSVSGRNVPESPFPVMSLPCFLFHHLHFPLFESLPCKRIALLVVPFPLFFLHAHKACRLLIPVTAQQDSINGSAPVTPKCRADSEVACEAVKGCKWYGYIAEENGP